MNLLYLLKPHELQINEPLDFEKREKMSRDKRAKAQEAKLKALEQNFNLTNLGSDKKPDYNALYDPNMRHYFENGKIQKLLLNTGQIDHHGRVIDMEKNKSKIAILEREFAEAERVEMLRQKEEMEMRVSFSPPDAVF